MNIQVSRQTILRFYVLLFAGNVFLILMTGLSDLGVSWAKGPVFREFDLKAEGTISVWYSSALLLLTSMAALAVGSLGSATRFPGRLYRLTWYGAASVFMMLSIDETAQLHERAGRIFTAWVGGVRWLTDGTARPTFGWVALLLPAICLFVIGMIAAARSWLALNPRSRTCAVAGAVCWTGVIFAEVLEAQLRRWSMNRSVEGAIEEGLEVIGSTLFLMSFLEFLQRSWRTPEQEAEKVLGSSAPVSLEL